jgi:hypothetical protein
MNKKENWLRLIHNDNPGWIGDPLEAFAGFGSPGIILDPIQIKSLGKSVFDVPYMDEWGVWWMQKAEVPFGTPYITEQNKAIKDIRSWEEEIHFPDLDGHDWSKAEQIVSAVDRDEYLVTNMMFGGLFERSHYLMGFEDALCNYMLEPELMFLLLEAIADWKIGELTRVFDHLSPDAILYHDDWGTKTSLFLPPNVWRETVKPHHKRIVDFVKSKGAIFIHHADGICAPIVEDMVEMGIDVWQGAIPQDNIVGIQKLLKGKMAIMGGIDAAVIDQPVADEAVIRQEVRRCIDTYCPQGYFVPCIPNITPMSREVESIYIDELKRYGGAYINGKQP